jgi:hypothetical protein
MKKQEVRLMFFSGFYESIHDDVFDREVEDILTEDYPTKEYDDFRFKYDYHGYCKSYVSEISSEIGIDMTFKDLFMPKEYNFTTDVIVCEISSKDVKKLSTSLNSETLRNIIKRRFTSRDGFISFYSNSLDEWNEKKLKDWDGIELGTLLEAWIIDNDLDLENLDYAGFEYCQGNGQYVNYEKLWDEEKETEEIKFHEDEINKLEKWNKSVSAWSE